MTSRGTTALLGLLLLLALYVWLGELRGVSGPPTPHSEAPLGPADSWSPQPRSPAPQGPGLIPDAVRAETLTLIKQGHALVLHRTAEGWHLAGMHPLSGPDAADVEDFVRNLAQIGEIMTVDERAETLSDFGLQQPERILQMKLPNDQEHHLHIGRRNPAWTASYARLADEERVILIGALLTSQFDRIHERLAKASAAGRVP